MKAATANLIALFATSRQFALEDVSVWTLADGTTFNLSTNPANSPASSPIFKRGGVRTHIGIEAASMSIDLLCNSGSLLANLPAISFALNGGLDGANVTCTRLWRANSVAPVAGNTHVFTGSIGDVDVDAAGIHMTALSDMQLLNMALPRNMFQAGCLHDLYDHGCALDPAAFTVAGVVTSSGTTAYVVNSNSLAQNTGYFDQGVLAFTSGAMNGTSRAVKTYVKNGAGNSSITPMLPLPLAPSAGDTFTIKPGCDKTFNTCVQTFNNADNFRGYEFIPTPETGF